MVIPAVMLVILALAVMRALMGVVAHEDAAAPPQSGTAAPSVPGSPAPELRAQPGDALRAFLLPAAEAPLAGEPAPVDDPERSTAS